MGAIAQTFDAETAAGQTATVLPGIIGFFFSIRILMVLLSVRILQQDPQTGVALSLGLNFLLFVVVVFSSFGSAPRTLASILRLPSCLWVVLFLGFSGCSLVWSVASSLPAAAAFWCAMTADVAMVVLLLRTGPISAVSSGLMKGHVYGTCCLALVAWILPAQSDLRLGDEELLGANQFGYACALAIFFAQYLIYTQSKQSRWKFAAGFMAITLFRSLSKTTIVAFVAGETILLILEKSISRKTKIMLVLATVVVIALASGLLIAYYDIYTNAGNQAETLTGRLGIWAYILNEAVDRPWIGHGFHSVWKVIPPFGDFEARHAHNELIQQFYAYGVVGIFILVGLYGSFYRQVRKLARSPLKTLLLGLLIFAIVRGFADTEAFDLSFPLWAIVMFSAIMSQSHQTAVVGRSLR
jgi:exopolysaccharide production protein ExoQ